MKKIYQKPRINFNDYQNVDVLTESVGVDWNGDWGNDWDPYQEG